MDRHDALEAINKLRREAPPRQIVVEPAVFDAALDALQPRQVFHSTHPAIHGRHFLLGQDVVVRGADE